FNLTLINPGDIPLTDLEVSSRIYRIEEGVEIDVPEVSVSLTEPVAELSPSVRKRLSLQMQADADAPDEAIAEITFISAEGAGVTFVGEVSLLPAIPILTVASPRVGYVQGSVDRGDIYSRQVTIENRGLRALEDIVITPPQEIPWMQLNLPRDADGLIRIPDLEVGETFTFDTVFVPSNDVEMGYYRDEIVISGSNAVSDFTVQVAATVTSNFVGNLTALVTNSLGQAVPNASLRLRHSVLGHDLDPVMTDSEGRVTVTDLSEGNWSWHLSAPGHGAQAGVVEIQADETAEISAELHRSLVTIEFNVVPVPFTDRYEIKLEMTFETFVPAPVLTMTPPKYEFENLPANFEATVMFTLKNEGLIRMYDIEIEGTETRFGRLTPMIEYLPELLPQQSVAVPFRLEYAGREGEQTPSNESGIANASSGDRATASIWTDLDDCFTESLPFPGADVMQGLAALANGKYRSVSAAEAADGIGAVILILAGAQALTDVRAFPFQLIACMGGKIFGGKGRSDSSGGSRGPGTNGKGPFRVGGIGCFLADTPVLLADGSYGAIQTLKTGDKVVSNVQDNINSIIRHTYKIESDELYRLTVAPVSNRSTTREILVTGEHRIWTDTNGWLAVRNLEVGEWLHGQSGEMIEIISTELLPGTHEVYTFQLQGDSAFYADGILVEDLCGGLYLEDPESLKEITE
ncbi:MAG TPA: hypothetical protein VK041_00755, partial [Opitutales bacterium]|nr:hypothetical protein [Opitutales bacterium]